MKFRWQIALRNFFGTLFFLTASPAVMAAEAPMTASQILDKVAEKYKTCRSFSAEAQSSDTSNIKTASNYQTEKSAKFWFTRPELLRVDWTNKMSFNPKTSSNAIFVRKGQVYTFEDYGVGPKTYTKQDSVGMAMAAHTGISAGLTNQVPSLLLGKNYYKVQPWTLGPDLLIDGQACFNLNSISRSAGIRKSQWAVSKTSLELLQTKESTQMSAEEVKKMITDAEKMSGTKFDFVKEYPAIDNETITRYKNIVWNPGLKESDFDYALPKEAKLVTDEEKLKATSQMIKDAEKMMDEANGSGSQSIVLETEGKYLMVDDFESGTGRNLLGGTWQTFADKNGKGTVFTTQKDFVVSGGANGSRHAARLAGHFGKNTEPWPYVALMGALSSEGPVNLGQFSTVEFMARGDGKQYQTALVLKQDTNNGNYTAQFTAPKEWTKVRLNFSDFQQPVWAKQVPREFQAVTELSFGPSKMNDEDFDLFIDDIKFIKGSTATQEGDLVHWMKEADALKLSKATGKPVLYDFMAAWCGPCKRMAKEVFGNPETASWINQNFLAVRIQDQRMETGSNPGRTTDLYKKYERRSFPMLIVDLPGKSLLPKWKTALGYRDPASIRQFLEDALKQLKDAN